MRTRKRPWKEIFFQGRFWSNTLLDELEARTQQELQAVITLLTELTGLPSRWSGRVELVPDAEFKGKKRFACDIQINAALAAQDERWTTLIHEALHAVSTGYVRDDYQRFQGWEEGVVEQLQRILRNRVLLRLGVSVNPQVFKGLDEEHGYNKFIAALEMVREALNIPAEQSEAFYLDLLSTPLRDRLSHINAYGFLLSNTEKIKFFALISTASAALRTQNN